MEGAPKKWLAEWVFICQKTLQMSWCWVFFFPSRRRKLCPDFNLWLKRINVSQPLSGVCCLCCGSGLWWFGVKNLYWFGEYDIRSWKSLGPFRQSCFHGMECPQRYMYEPLQMFPIFSAENNFQTSWDHHWYLGVIPYLIVCMTHCSLDILFILWLHINLVPPTDPYKNLTWLLVLTNWLYVAHIACFPRVCVCLYSHTGLLQRCMYVYV